jgi:hypothetical protein
VIGLTYSRVNSSPCQREEAPLQLCPLSSQHECETAKQSPKRLANYHETWPMVVVRESLQLRPVPINPLTIRECTSTVFNQHFRCYAKTGGNRRNNVHDDCPFDITPRWSPGGMCLTRHSLCTAFVYAKRAGRPHQPQQETRDEPHPTSAQRRGQAIYYSLAKVAPKYFLLTFAYRQWNPFHPRDKRPKELLGIPFLHEALRTSPPHNSCPHL